jgi:hypothetical protein
LTVIIQTTWAIISDQKEMEVAERISTEKRLRRAI